MTRLLTVAVCVMGTALVGGCASDPRAGYSLSPAFRTDIETVSVPMWENKTFYHGLESDLAQALVTELQRSTPYKVSGGDQSGSVLEGTITLVELRPLTRSRETGLVQEMAVEIVCDFTWRDNRTGKVLLARRGFSAARSFVPARPVGERIEVGQLQAVQHLSKDIVGLMRSGW